MDQLKEIYSHYYDEALKVRAKAPILAGIWGMGKDPRNDRCHDEFYEAVEKWVGNFDGDAAAALEAVKWILGAALVNKNRDTYWHLFAAHGLTLPLIEKLDTADCKELFSWYDASYPKRERLPLQQQVWKALKKAAK